MINSKFAFIQAPEETGRHGRILYTRDPFFTGEVVIFENQWFYLQAVADESILDKCTIAGYMIMIKFAGTIDGRKIPTDRSTFTRISGILSGMADFFLEEKINKKPTFFSRYKLIQNAPGNKISDIGQHRQ